MKRIKLKESDLKRVIQRIINERQYLNENIVFDCYSKDSGGNCVNSSSTQATSRPANCPSFDECNEGSGMVADKPGKTKGRSTGSGGRDYSTFAHDDRREMGESARYLREAETSKCGTDDAECEPGDACGCDSGPSCYQCSDDCTCPDGGKVAHDLKSLKRAEMKEMQRIRARALNERRIILNRSRGISRGKRRY